MKISLTDDPNPILKVEDIPTHMTNFNLPTKTFMIVIDLGAIFNFKSKASNIYKMKVMCGSMVTKLSETVAMVNSDIQLRHVKLQ